VKLNIEKYRVGYVFQDEYPWDIRVEKITSSLSDAGIGTVIISRNRTSLPVTERLNQSLLIQRLPGPSLGWLRTLINFPAFFSPVWFWRIYRTVVERKLSLLIVRDLPLSITCWLVARMCRIPVIMDMAENYPAMIQDTWDFRGRDRFDYILRNPRVLRMMEYWITKRLDGIMTVSPASQARVRSIPGVKPGAVWVIQNTPMLEKAGQLRASELSERMRCVGILKLLYVGGMEESRGLMMIIESLPEVIKSAGQTMLIIVGEGTSRTGLEAKVGELGLESSVVFSGWLDQSYVPGIIAESDICLVPHLVTEHIDTTVPNKIFDYMAQSKPVLVTQSKSLRNIVEGYHCGGWYEDKSSQSFSDAIEKLADRAQREQLGRNGKRAVDEYLNWETDSSELVRIAKGFID